MTPKLAHTLDSLANEFQYDPSGRWGVETVGPIREAARIIAALEKQPAASGEPLSGKWEGAEEWMPLAWELCADECGEEACTELVWEGGPVPEPWGDRWLKFEDEAKRLIALVRKHAPAAQPAPALVPLTDEQALEIAVTATPPGSMVSRSQIVEAIRLAERHHGIFPSKENPL